MNGSTNFEIMQGMYCYVSQDNWGKRRLLHESLGFVVRHLHPHLVRLGLLVDPVQLLVLLLHLKRIIYIIDSAVCSGRKVHLSAHVVRHVPQVADHCPNLKLSFMFFFLFMLLQIHYAEVGFNLFHVFFHLLFSIVAGDFGNIGALANLKRLGLFETF